MKPKLAKLPPPNPVTSDEMRRATEEARQLLRNLDAATADMERLTPEDFGIKLR